MHMKITSKMNAVWKVTVRMIVPHTSLLIVVTELKMER